MTRYSRADRQQDQEPARLVTPGVLIGAVLVTILLLTLTALWVVWSAPPAQDASSLLAVVTVLPAPTETPAAPATPTFDPYAATPTPTLAPGQFAAGDVVQITGTQGAGLRIRSEAGLSGKQLFMGFDTEAYNVIDGPVQMDGHTWYQLAAVNDEKRVGWAASDYLVLIPKP